MIAASPTVAPAGGFSGLGRRWLKFNIVGGLGIGVQLTALWILARGFHCNYLVATALAVETAVLHNFLWHQRFTWAERRQEHQREAVVRFLRFNLTNGVVSILGNVVLMGLLAGALHLALLSASLASIAICSAANFLLSENYVFRATLRSAASTAESANRSGAGN